MKKLKLEAALLITFLTLSLVGCETTSYEYSAPKNAVAAKSIRKCLELKQYATQSCEYNERRCLDHLLYNGKTDTENFHDKFRCGVEKGRCIESAESDYRQCYEASGGTVKTIIKK